MGRTKDKTKCPHCDKIIKSFSVKHALAEHIHEQHGFYRDDMLFVPYMDNGYQAKLNIGSGTISVRFKGRGLFTDAKHPYEVWYPHRDAPDGYQTADDIWEYIRTMANDQ